MVATSNLRQYKRLIENIAEQGGKHDYAFFDIITIAMSVVEHIRQEKILTSQEKKELAKDLLPVILDFLVESGKIAEGKAEDLKSDYQEKIAYVEEFIDTAAIITNDPNMINAGKWLLKQGKNYGCHCTII